MRWHLVGETTYRDVWLAEAFAEYSAMMFVQATMKDGPKLFQEILAAYRDEVSGVADEEGVGFYSAPNHPFRRSSSRRASR